MTITDKDLHELIPDMRICSFVGGETHLLIMSQQQYDDLGPDSYAALCDAFNRHKVKVIMVVAKDPSSAFRCFRLEDKPCSDSR